MFEHPGDVMKQEKSTFAAACLDSIMDVDDSPSLQLPHFNKSDESLPRITKETMVDILDGKYGECYDRSVIIDCRFEYEYDGGHIEGAINVNDKERLADQLFESPNLDKTLLVFHCEYSAHRAPIMYVGAMPQNAVRLTVLGPNFFVTKTVLAMLISTLN